jgi:hypothetical protein
MLVCCGDIVVSYWRRGAFRDLHPLAGGKVEAVAIAWTIIASLARSKLKDWHCDAKRVRRERRRETAKEPVTKRQRFRHRYRDLVNTDGEGATPLLHAALCGHDTVARALLAAGADARARDADGVCATDVRPREWAAWWPVV